jgi:hypothetical protein
MREAACHRSNTHDLAVNNKAELLRQQITPSKLSSGEDGLQHGYAVLRL